MKLGIAAAAAAWLFTGDWVLAASVLTLAAIWTCVRTDEGPPVLQLALTLQWVEVSIGVFYVLWTGRPLEATLRSDYRPMVLIGLGCVGALIGGVAAGLYLIRRLKQPAGFRPEYALTFKTLAVCYIVGVMVVGSMNRFAWEYPSLTQAIIALTYARLGLLYLVLRRLVKEGQWPIFAGLLAFEVVLGITGFYAGFREPLIMAVLAVLEVFDGRSVRQWALVGVLAVAMAGLGVIWIGIRRDYRDRFMADEAFAGSRSQRIDSVSESISGWASRDASELTADVDRFIDRLWAIYYPALAVERVPAVLPHTDGALMKQALVHVFMPRILFPDKPGLISDSEMVRKYSGVMVAGEEQNTSIAFGYSAESYVDYGVPLMFLPVFVFGVLIGAAYAMLLRLIRHRDMAVSIATVIVWMSLYLFERSWAKTLGLTGTMLIYVGGIGFIFDRLWFEKSRRQHASAAAEAVGSMPAWSTSK